MIFDGISFDEANPKYRQIKCDSGILEYTLEHGEITVDWVSGKHTSAMLKAILAAEVIQVTRISGYVTDKLGDSSGETLQRFASRLAHEIGFGWQANIEIVRNRRYLVLTK